VLLAASLDVWDPIETTKALPSPSLRRLCVDAVQFGRNVDLPMPWLVLTGVFLQAWANVLPQCHPLHPQPLPTNSTLPIQSHHSTTIPPTIGWHRRPGVFPTAKLQHIHRTYRQWSEAETGSYRLVDERLDCGEIGVLYTRVVAQSAAG